MEPESGDLADVWRGGAIKANGGNVGFTTEERGLVEAGLPERRGAARIGSDAEILFPPVYQRGGRSTGEASVPQCG
jgi:hypothetical protein